MNRSFILSALLLFLTTFITACGGSGGGGGGGGSSSSSSSSSSGGLQTGVFIDGPVQGLSYATPTRSGLTNDAGEFSYQDGETVTFSIGGIELGSAPGAAQVSPFDLFDMEPITDELALRLELQSRGDVTDFDRVANIAFLLVSLDNDANPDNGLDLIGWHNALAGIDLDLDVNLYKFAKKFRRFAGEHGINPNVTPVQPLAHLYESLDITVPVHQVTAVVTDFEDDGDDDYVLAWGYDANGFTNFFAVDGDADGNFDQNISSYVYTSQGRTGMFDAEVDTNDDGTPDTVQTQIFTYDGNGNLATLLAEEDSDGNGVINFRLRSTYSYDVFGDRLSSQREVDTDLDGDMDSIVVLTSYTHDGAGNLLQEVQEMSGMVVTFTYTYDGAGNMLSKLQETDNGSVESAMSEVYTYDTVGNLLTKNIEQDFDGDGPNPVGFRDSYTYTYDSQGNPLTFIRERRNDGVTVDSRERSTYTYNGDGTLRISLFFEMDSNLNGVYGEDDDFNITTTYVHDGFGNWLSQLQEIDNDTGPDIDQVDLVRHEYTTLNDGLPSLLFHYSDLTLF